MGHSWKDKLAFVGLTWEIHDWINGFVRLHVREPDDGMVVEERLKKLSKTALVGMLLTGWQVEIPGKVVGKK